jgi:hypothetical protein
MKKLLSSSLRFFPTLVGLIFFVSVGSANAQQGPVRIKSQSMLVTASVEPSCSILWTRLSEQIKGGDLRLCESPRSTNAILQNSVSQKTTIVSYTLTIVDQQTRLDF